MPPADMVRIPYKALDDFTHDVLHRLGVSSADAQTAVNVLSQANLRGVDTHGSDLFPAYVQRIQSGMVNTSPKMKIIKESAATVVIDADRALGQISSRFGMQEAINKAVLSGIGWVNIINSNHHGALAYYALMAAEQDLIGIVTTTTSACMAPWGSREALVGNNPLAIAIPCNNHDPLILDMASSLFANGKVRLAKERGEPLPDGLSIDADGNPNSDPSNSAALLPMGDYKGSGLAMMLGFLAGGLAGQPFTGYGKSNKEGKESSELSHLMIAVNIDNFTDLEEFKDSVDEVIDSWKNSEPRPGFDEVFVPGEIEWRRVPDREENGIPLNASLVAEMKRIGDEVEVEFPSAI